MRGFLGGTGGRSLPSTDTTRRAVPGRTSKGSMRRWPTSRLKAVPVIVTASPSGSQVGGAPVDRRRRRATSVASAQSPSEARTVSAQRRPAGTARSW